MVLTGLSKKLVAIFQTMDFQNIEMYEFDRQITETVVKLKITIKYYQVLKPGLKQ